MNLSNVTAAVRSSIASSETLLGLFVRKILAHHADPAGREERHEDVLNHY